MASGNNFRYVIKTFKNHAHTILNAQSLVLKTKISRSDSICVGKVSTKSLKIDSKYEWPIVNIVNKLEP